VERNPNPGRRRKGKGEIPEYLTTERLIASELFQRAREEVAIVGIV
jgi:hypothetical protein